MPDVVVDVGNRQFSAPASDVQHVIGTERLAKLRMPQSPVVGLCSYDGQAMPAVWLGSGNLPATGVVTSFRGAPIVVLGRIDIGDAGESLADALEAVLG